jgi:hypothetical protein
MREFNPSAQEPSMMSHGKWRRRDRNVAFRAAGGLGIAWLVAGSLLIHAPAAHACSRVGTGIQDRKVWPAAQQGIPVNARLVVEYSTGASVEGFDVPALGPDVALLDGDTPVATTFQLVGSRVVLNPAATLLPNHAYSIADRRTVPCYAIPSGCTLTDAPQVFASFTTGSAVDSTPPTFAGLAPPAVADRLVCDSGACCGPYDVVPVDLSWMTGSDDVAGSDLRYNLYALPDGGVPARSLLVGLADAMTLRGFETCAGPFPGELELKPGRYMVRAVDWAGNEDQNSQARSLGQVCSQSINSQPTACAVAGSDARGATNLGALLIFAAATAVAIAVRRRAGA